MQYDPDEFSLVLNESIKVTRRTGYTTTAMGDRRTTGETVVYSGLSVYIDWTYCKYVMAPTGTFTVQQYLMLCPPLSDLNHGDMVYNVTGPDGMTMGRIVESNPIKDFDGYTHHLEATIERLG